MCFLFQSVAEGSRIGSLPLLATSSLLPLRPWSAILQYVAKRNATLDLRIFEPHFH